MVLFSRNKPKIKVETTKKDSFSGWLKCSGCLDLIHANELQNNLNCCPKCGYHYRISVKQRIELLCDEDTFEEKFTTIQPVDALHFEDSKKYSTRLDEAREKTSRDESVCVGICEIQQMPVALAIMDFTFMGGSMGSVVGERLCSIMEYAVENDLPLVIVSASGGARMQESILSLMQMAKTSGALTKLHEKGLPYISVLTNPTTGGVTASFASLGDIIIAEPEALIAFAGPRVVEQTIKEKLPKGAQRAEFVLEHGMIDCIVKRSELKKQVAFFLEFLTNTSNVDVLDEKMSQKLKDLLKISERKEKTESAIT